MKLAEGDFDQLIAGGWSNERHELLKAKRAALQESVGIHGIAKTASSKHGEKADSAMTELKSWKRKTTNWVANALGVQEAQDDFKTGATIGQSARLMGNWVRKVLPALDTHKDALSAEGMPADWKSKGEALLATLDGDKTNQTLAVANLPVTTANAYLERANTYDLLKKLNRIGRNLHDEAPEQAKRYNLDLLNAHGEPDKKK